MKRIGGINMATANINVRTDAALKAQAQEIYESIGLDLSTAVNLFLKQTVKANNLPFVVGAMYANHENPQSHLPQARRKPLYGCSKDRIWVADDFDEPIDDFTEYM
jgi:DNA-damage-inducible protein J